MSLANKLSITDVDLKGKRVLIRVRFPFWISPLHPSQLIDIDSELSHWDFL